MPLYRNKGRMVLFIHVPKTGGSTVEEVLKSHSAAQGLKYHKRLGYSNCTPQHIHWEVMKHWVPEGFYDYSFMTVRHPTSRLISEYHWRKKISQKTLPEFDTWIQNQIKSYENNNFTLDNHIRPQHEFSGPKTEIFKLENGLKDPVETALRELDAKCGDLQIHHARKSSREILTIPKSTLEKVIEFYKGDFEKFGYNPDDVPSDLNITN